MKHHKNLLKLNDLAAFREYLVFSCGLDCRDGKGDFEVLQVKIDKTCWAPINRNAQNQLTTHPELRPLIMGFYRTGKAAPRQTKPETDYAPIPMDVYPAADARLKQEEAQAKHQKFLEDLRDDIAMYALQGMLAWPGDEGSGSYHSNSDPAHTASMAYEYADAMLKARGK